MLLNKLEKKKKQKEQPNALMAGMSAGNSFSITLDF